MKQSRLGLVLAVGVFTASVPAGQRPSAVQQAQVAQPKITVYKSPT